MKKSISRNEFLKRGAVATSGVAALTMLGAGLTKSQKVQAGGLSTSWPYPYAQLDPEVVRKKAHDAFWGGYACSAGAFDGIIATLAEVVGEPYLNFPTKMMIFGHGGGAGWGTICGALNGSCAAISLVCEKAVSDVLVSELFGWYTQAKFPSDESNTYARDHAYNHNDFDMALPQNSCSSPLCHISVSEWCSVADTPVGDNQRKERCARLAGDVAAKAVELLNAQFNGTFTSEYVTPESTTTCLACHGSSGMEHNVASKMDCVQCHTADPHTVGIENTGIQFNTFKVKQNYPNPFNGTTTIEFDLNSPERVTIEVFNLNGRHIKTLMSNKPFQAGAHSIQWNGNNEDGNRVNAGMYIYRFRVGKAVKTISMMKM